MIKAGFLEDLLFMFTHCSLSKIWKTCLRFVVWLHKLLSFFVEDLLFVT